MVENFVAKEGFEPLGRHVELQGLLTLGTIEKLAEKQGFESLGELGWEGFGPTNLVMGLMSSSEELVVLSAPLVALYPHFQALNSSFPSRNLQNLRYNIKNLI